MFQKIFFECNLNTFTIIFKSIGEAPKFVKSLEDQTVSEGSMITFKCIIRSNPVPNIQWFHNNRRIRQSKNFLMEYESETGFTSLTVKQIYKDDIGVFKCVADNKYGRCESSAKLNVEGKISQILSLFSIDLNLNKNNSK